MAEKDQAQRPSGVRDTVAESRERDARRREAETEHARGGKSSGGKGEAVVSGRFAPGQRVRLFEVAGPWVLRSAAGKEVESKKVDDDGTVKFTGLDMDRRYFAVGQVRGRPVEVRITPGYDADAAQLQQPVQRDRRRLADGRWLDEVESGEAAREIGEDADEVGLATGEQAPYPAQETVRDGKVRQRSDTPLGAATPIPGGDPVDIAAGGPEGAMKESASSGRRGSSKKEDES